MKTSKNGVRSSSFNSKREEWPGSHRTQYCLTNFLFYSVLIFQLGIWYLLDDHDIVPNLSDHQLFETWISFSRSRMTIEASLWFDLIYFLRFFLLSETGTVDTSSAAGPPYIGESQLDSWLNDRKEEGVRFCTDLSWTKVK